MKSYTELIVWQESIKLVKEIYAITRRFPKEEIYGLISQMRRSAISIPSNIAEGFMRQHRPEIVQFLYIALGSCGELNTQLIIAKELKFIDENVLKVFQEKLNHISRMIRNLVKSLKNVK
jgi:four helix bundle protein